MDQSSLMTKPFVPVTRIPFLRNNSGSPRQILHQPRDEANSSQAGDFARARQRFFERNTFDGSRFNFRDAPVCFSLPSSRNRRDNATLPRGHDSVYQFGHNLARHFTFRCQSFSGVIQVSVLDICTLCLSFQCMQVSVLDICTLCLSFQ